MVGLFPFNYVEVRTAAYYAVQMFRFPVHGAHAATKTQKSVTFCIFGRLFRTMESGQRRTDLTRARQGRNSILWHRPIWNCR